MGPRKPKKGGVGLHGLSGEDQWWHGNGQWLVLVVSLQKKLEELQR